MAQDQKNAVPLWSSFSMCNVNCVDQNTVYFVIFLATFQLAGFLFEVLLSKTSKHLIRAQVSVVDQDAQAADRNTVPAPVINVVDSDSGKGRVNHCHQWLWRKWQWNWNRTEWTCLYIGFRFGTVCLAQIVGPHHGDIRPHCGQGIHPWVPIIHRLLIGKEHRNWQGGLLTKKAVSTMETLGFTKLGNTQH